MGVSWYGGRLSKKRVLRVAEKAVAIARQALDVIEARPVGELPGLVRDGMVAGLKLGTDTVTAVHEKLTALGIDEVDEKLLRLGNDTGMALCRLGIRVIEGEFRARRDDVLEKLLLQIAATRGAAPPEK